MPADRDSSPRRGGHTRRRGFSPPFPSHPYLSIFYENEVMRASYISFRIISTCLHLSVPDSRCLFSALISSRFYSILVLRLPRANSAFDRYTTEHPISSASMIRVTQSLITTILLINTTRQHQGNRSLEEN